MASHGEVIVVGETQDFALRGRWSTAKVKVILQNGKWHRTALYFGEHWTLVTPISKGKGSAAGTTGRNNRLIHCSLIYPSAATICNTYIYCLCIRFTAASALVATKRWFTPSHGRLAYSQIILS